MDVRNATRVLALALIASPALLHAQKNEIISLQRDVAQLQDQVNRLQKSQDDKMAALTALVQQALDASNKTSSSLATLQRGLTESVGEQQKTVIDRVVTLGTKVDQMSMDFGSVSQSVQELSRRLSKLDSTLTDISSAVRTLSQPPAAPPPAPGGSASAAPNGPAVSAVSLRQDAERDYSSGKYDLAMPEFVNYVKLFPDDAYAPTAQYNIGMIYDMAKQYKDAADAFDAVVERFPRNERTADAAYMKAVELMKDGQRTAAGEEFKNFIADYPGNEHMANARAHLRELGLSAPAGARSNSKGKKK